jgi:hypothetical protein
MPPNADYVRYHRGPNDRTVPCEGDGCPYCAKRVIANERAARNADSERVMRRLLERSSLAMTELWIECPTHGHQAKDPDTGECLACVVYCQSCGYPAKALHHHGQGKGAHPFVAPAPSRQECR